MWLHSPLNAKGWRSQWIAVTLQIFITISLTYTTCAQKEEGEICHMTIEADNSRISGICKVFGNCPHLENVMTKLHLKAKDVVSCGFTIYEELICCPNLSDTRSTFIDMTPNTKPNPNPNIITTTTTTTTTTTPRTVVKSGTLRKAARVCMNLEMGLSSRLGPQIIGGRNVEEGEYFHMAALGYPIFGTGSYDFRCGGTLISDRYVLTAAHCVFNPRNLPEVVLLGKIHLPSDFNEKNDNFIKIKNITQHPLYSSLRKYNDIAIIELEEAVKYTGDIYPACLYTENSGPSVNTTITVAGWGVMDLRAMTRSNTLKHANVTIVSRDECHNSYKNHPSVNRGILPSQVCTLDRDFKNDACFSDSGGPLFIAANENHPNVHVVGIISAGEGCTSAAPSLYTRINSFLDFIEDKVWPDL